MKFRWRSWLKSSGMNHWMVRRIAQKRTEDNLIFYCHNGYTVDLVDKTIKYWEVSNGNNNV